MSTNRSISAANNAAESVEPEFSDATIDERRRTGKSSFVLVHGAWHGGWCWREVRDRLREQGHDVYTPTLTGLGERQHLAGPNVNLDTHIEDVLNVLIWDELSNVVLVGHSYAGMVITGVADRAPDWISSLVYVDAVLPEPRQPMLAVVPPRTRRAITNKGRQWTLAAVRAAGVVRHSRN